MRFMMFMYPQIAEEEWNPTAEDIAAMTRFNDELRKAGMLLALDGLKPPSEGGDGQLRGRRGQGDRRSLRRGQGGRRRLLADPGALHRGGGRVGQALPGAGLPDRGPTDLRDRGLPRGLTANESERSLLLRRAAEA